MDETKLLNYLKGESDAEECLEVEAWYHASAEPVSYTHLTLPTNSRV